MPITPDHMQLLAAYETIQKVAATSSKLDKEKILKQGESEHLRALLHACYNKFQTYRIQQIEQPYEYKEHQADTLEIFLELCADLAAHKLGTNEAKTRIRQFLSRNTRQMAELYTSILTRDIRAGIDEKTINKVFHGLIPVFSCQLANKVEDLDKIKVPVVVDKKLDGMRALAVCDGDTVKFFSREGRELDECGVIAQQVYALAPGMKFVLDGEFLAQKFNPDNKVCKKYAGSNWPFNYALSLVKTQDKTSAEVEEFLGYYVWDVIDYDCFLSQGKLGIKQTLTERRITLSNLLNRRPQEASNLHLLPNYVCTSRRQILDLFQQWRREGEEGAMLKDPNMHYEFKRSNAVLKLKEFFTLDLRVTGAEEGTGKYEGMLGALHVADDEGKLSTKVGSGFDDDDRANLWVEFLAGRLIGKIVEVSGQEITRDGSIRFPTFVGLRWDKTTTNTEGLV